VAASVAAHLIAVQRGARIVRVHDVAATVDALKIWQAVGPCRRRVPTPRRRSAGRTKTDGIDRRPLAIAVMGPTASGKTATAIALAAAGWRDRQRRFGAGVPPPGHRLGQARCGRARAAASAGPARSWQTYSAAEFAADAGRVVADIVARGKLPILAGGTGLYFRACCRACRRCRRPIRRCARRSAPKRPSAAGRHCTQSWPGSIRPRPRIHATDPQRIQRALEVYRLTGTPSLNGSAGRRGAAAGAHPQADPGPA
jgi:hypothetical protein